MRRGQTVAECWPAFRYANGVLGGQEGEISHYLRREQETSLINRLRA
jgi:hypothetical protein